MLDRILRHGVRSSSFTVGMCWRCLLERQHLQRSLHNTPSRFKSSANTPNVENKAETKAATSSAPATARKSEHSKDAAPKSSEKTKSAKIDSKSTTRSNTSSRRRRKEKTRVALGLAKGAPLPSIPKSRTKGAPERGDIAKDTPGWAERSGRVKDGGRLRMRRHMASLKKDPTFAEMDGGKDSAGISIEEAMSGTSMEGGEKKSGEMTAEFMTKDLRIEGQYS